MMSSSRRDLTMGMRITCERKKCTAGNSMADMAAHATPSWAKTWVKLSEHLSAEFWHHKEDERLRQEGHGCSSRVTKNTGTAQGILTGDDVFAQVRFPN